MVDIIRFHAIVALLRLSRPQPPRRTTPLLVMMAAALVVILYAPPIVGFGAALTAAAFWLFVVD